MSLLRSDRGITNRLQVIYLHALFAGIMEDWGSLEIGMSKTPTVTNPNSWSDYNITELWSEWPAYKRKDLNPEYWDTVDGVSTYHGRVDWGEYEPMWGESVIIFGYVIWSRVTIGPIAHHYPFHMSSFVPDPDVPGVRIYPGEFIFIKEGNIKIKFCELCPESS